MMPPMPRRKEPGKPRIREAQIRWAYLTRSHRQTIVKALDPILKEWGSREKAALALGLLGRSEIEPFMRDRAGGRVREELFVKVTKALKLDISGWDVTDSI